ncbi:MAG: 16S rRNA (adenine(1518)-N(6)/adenine(1519)-N(6))-dimethyltransferase RsmA [Ruminococcus sp.]|nr:16S rRNA (adenine(1518)-N(6)/adenine(1519)-N(6))-dimethyltransferase RsmA [Ruminococcus sp.]
MENLSNIGVIKDLMKRYGFSFSKGLGQNFLINPTVCPKIAEMGNAKEGFGIIEIGTGFGVLTCELAKRADKVIAVEIDSRLIPVLSETLAEFDNVKVINDDILKIDLSSLIRQEFNELDIAVCANLPYYLTSPIIMSLLELKLPIKTITVMVQKEAGVRLCAPLGTREAGAITVAINYYAKARCLFDVKRGSFMPPPNVDSCVIQLEIKDTLPQVSDEKFFFETVKAAFSQRRKTLVNSLSSYFNLSKEKVITVVKSVGLKETVRPEQLQMVDFISLADSLKSAYDF